MGSAEFIPYLDFIADFAGAAADLFGALSFFSGSAESAGQLLG
ncbi:MULTISPECIES: hypothetical protein [Prescottella]|jgi:hypothetical protein|uniref:Uncharacterized protein n=1 Tax=Prescottella equi ATCC 33707 TaxID=525370 RepID=E9SX87_RHOHA|nr:hypothetical protein [Prescottella equi]GBF17007.1 hypothetical protein Br6_04410 [Rhodococcus sp. Br-6]EGD25524.1 hypothetical protein HMPREF0724_10738 [Prescottella equi ATCC 33707]MDP8017253.1 hypothetical protein [Prescottella equi]WJJ11298.1 hypothetical protein P9990_22465 [Prescottella equi]WQB72560.1 hypothetical protein SCD75_12075 [Prescottella equi]